MKTIVELNNNLYLEIISTTNNSPKEATDIRNLKMSDLSKKGRLLLIINFNNIKENEYKKLIKKLLSIKNKSLKRKIEIGISKGSKTLLGYVINYDENNKYQKEFMLAVNAIFYKTKYERYDYIYDTVCDYLDSFFYGKNFCDFKNNKCGEKKNTSSNIGCCHHYKNKILGPLLSNNLIPCEHLKEDHTCGAKCIGCKLFTCDYLESKGIKFRIKDIFLLDVFFNPLQKYFIKTMVFTPKNEILNRLVKL